MAAKLLIAHVFRAKIAFRPLWIAKLLKDESIDRKVNAVLYCIADGDTQSDLSIRDAGGPSCHCQQEQTEYFQ